MAQLVQTVEYTEHVNPVVCRFINEMADHIFRIIRISYRIRAAGEHLEKDIRRCFTHPAKPFPGTFIKETISHIKCRAAPVFKREELRHMTCGVTDRVHDIVCPHTGRQKRLVGITICRIHDHQFFLIHDPFGKFFRSPFFQHLPCTAGYCFPLCRKRRYRSEIGFFFRTRPGIAVDGDISDIVEQLRTAVADCFRFIQKLRMAVDVIDITETFLKILRAEHILKEIYICLHTADTEFIKAAEHFVYRILRMERVGRYFDQE